MFRKISLKECQSTQDHALDLFERENQANLFLAVRTDVQTGGRGRLGRHWTDTGKGNFLLSLAFRPRLQTSQLPLLSLISGLALFNVLKTFHPDLNFFIKWPNDLMVQVSERSFKKLGGILLELKNKILLVGIGVNVHSVDSSLENAVALQPLTQSPMKDFDLWMENLALEIFKLENQMLQSQEAFPELLQLQFKSAMMPMFGRKGFYLKNPQDPAQQQNAIAQKVNFQNGALLVELCDTGEILEVQSGEFSFSKINS